MLPTGGTVTYGDASFTSNGSSLLIDQTSGSAIINWNSFSIGAGNLTHFNNGSGATLNRVSGNVPSMIDGSLTATGSLYLINPSGVVVGTGGMVATGGTFAASTQDVTDADFLDGGDTVFAGDSQADILNYGTISSAMGDVALIARRVDNSGDISAPNGTAALLAGYDVLMYETDGSNGKFLVRAGGADTEVVNSGSINAAAAELRANGGNVLALAGNTEGVIKATGVATTGGRIFLTAGGGTVQAGGRITARRRISSDSSQETGGEVFINADTVLASAHIDVSGLGAEGGDIDIGGRDIALHGATLDASGDLGGGRIRVGGEYQGGAALTEDQVQNAETLLIDAASSLMADGTSGDAAGGTVIVWSDGTTTFDGTASVRGSATGDGGFVETSGAHLDLHGEIDVSSALGQSGTWLIDPVDITVDSSLIASILPVLEAGGDIVITTDNPGGDLGNITFADALTVDFANDASADDEATLTAFADNAITVDAAITALNGVFNIDATGTNGITINAAVDTNGGDITMVADAYAINATLDGASISFARSTSGTIGVGDGAAGDLTLTDAQLDLISANSLTIGDATNTTTINVDGIDLAAFDVVGFTAAGAVNLNDSAEAYYFGSLLVDAGEAHLGGTIHTSSVTFSAPVILDSDLLLSGTTGDVTFDGTIDGANSMDVSGGGEVHFNGEVGGSTMLAGLTVSGPVTVTGLVATTGSQSYDDQVTDDGTVFVSTGGSLTFAGGVSAVHPDSDVWFLAADDITFGGSAQWNGTGDMTLVAGWNAASDGSTGWTLGDTTADTATLETAGNYGLGTGNIQIGDGSQTNGIAVGSSGGTTTVLGGNLSLLGSDADDGFAQLGFVGAATGAIAVTLAGDLTATASSGARSYAQLGHGGYGDDNDHSGSISIDAGGDVTFGGGSSSYAYAQLGHGGDSAEGDHSGAVTINADSLTFNGGSGFHAYAQLGHGGYSGDGDRSGDISVSATGDLTFTAGPGLNAYAQLGHGGQFADGDYSGDIAISVADELTFTVGSNLYAYVQLGHGGLDANGNHSGDIAISAADLTFGGGSGWDTYAQLGHGGYDADGDHSGAITLTVDGDLELTGGSGTNAYAQIGHGDAAGTTTGTRIGDISALVGGVTTFDRQYRRLLVRPCDHDRQRDFGCRCGAHHRRPLGDRRRLFHHGHQ